MEREETRDAEVMTVTIHDKKAIAQQLAPPPSIDGLAPAVEHLASDEVLNLLRCVLESIEEGVCVVDHDGRLVMMNARAMRWFGGKSHDLLGQPLAQFAVLDEQVALPEGANGDGRNDATESRAVVRGTLTLCGCDDRTVRLNCTSRAISIGGRTGKVLVFDDGLSPHDHRAGLASVARNRHCGDEQAQEGMTAEKASARIVHRQTQFLAKISHELRTPMHAIMGFASLAIEKWGQVPPERLLRYVTLIRESGERLVRLVNELLDLSKLQAGHMPFRFQRVDLRGLVERVLSQTESLWREKALSIHWTESVPTAFVTCDEDRITQVLWNVVANAVKFSPPGGRIDLAIVHDSVPAGRREADSVRLPAVRVTIRDMGAGIPPDECARIFDLFVQAPNGHARQDGTGLGLAICREIVLAHGGNIWADNHEEGGAVISIVLPRHVPTWVRERVAPAKFSSD